MGERAPYSSLEMLVSSLSHRICKGEPTFIILSVDDQTGRIIILAINQQDYHLAIAALCAMMRAGAIAVSMARSLQIKRLHDSKAGIG
jgi:acyl-CoA synthetase (AMP-forming)/AMP-acid ligase II